MLSTVKSNEKAIGGRTTGLIELGETVTWEATHFGIRQKFTSRIIQMESPNFFVDEMVNGTFKSFWHKHTFTETAKETMMTDQFNYQSPLGFIGKIADSLFLEKYMTDLLKQRNQMIKDYAENGKWKDFIPHI